VPLLRYRLKTHADVLIIASFRSCEALNQINYEKSVS
jgi:hypothetical protein